MLRNYGYQIFLVAVFLGVVGIFYDIYMFITDQRSIRKGSNWFTWVSCLAMMIVYVDLLIEFLTIDITLRERRVMSKLRRR